MKGRAHPARKYAFLNSNELPVQAKSEGSEIADDPGASGVFEARQPIRNVNIAYVP